MGLNIGYINRSGLSIKNSFKRIIKQETLLDDPRSRKKQHTLAAFQDKTPPIQLLP